MHKRIFVIHKQDRNPLAHFCRHPLFYHMIALLRFTHGGNHCRCFQFGFCFFLFRIGIKQQRRTGTDFSHAVFHTDRAKRETGIHVAVEMHHADSTAIPCTGAAFVFFKEAHSPELRRSGYRYSPCVAEEAVKRIHAIAQTAFNMVNRVDQTRIHLDLTTTDNAYRTRLADAALVVAIHVRAHGQLRLVFLGIEQFQDLLGI
ncbi:hypothetical protein D3C80_600120 [compost metagenome]